MQPSSVFTGADTTYQSHCSKQFFKQCNCLKVYQNIMKMDTLHSYRQGKFIISSNLTQIIQSKYKQNKYHCALWTLAEIHNRQSGPQNWFLFQSSNAILVHVVKFILLVVRSTFQTAQKWVKRIAEGKKKRDGKLQFSSRTNHKPKTVL